MRKKINLKTSRTNEYVGYVYTNFEGRITKQQYRYQANKISAFESLIAEEEVEIVDSWGSVIGMINEATDYDQNGNIVNTFWYGLDNQRRA